ncbi:hypothetical protein BT63DRAFT_178059 [Microthyrium microscopicum]|uniref:Uncharacterized protein n=1 Tax=Microthyrium microscopicum TaxID=703497 RepID=A0A6A6UJS4_9PEZI|nr:hypothetical protein BT63DRAFT_178059 [Microthyrium microscopicum]
MKSFLIALILSFFTVVYSLALPNDHIRISEQSKSVERDDKSIPRLEIRDLNCDRGKYYLLKLMIAKEAFDHVSNYYEHTHKACMFLSKFRQLNVTLPWNPDLLPQLINTLKNTKTSVLIAMDALAKDQRPDQCGHTTMEYIMDSEASSTFTGLLADGGDLDYGECRSHIPRTTLGRLQAIQSLVDGDFGLEDKDLESNPVSAHIVPQWQLTKGQAEVYDLIQIYHNQSRAAFEDLARFQGVPLPTWPALIPDVTKIVQKTTAYITFSIANFESKGTAQKPERQIGSYTIPSIASDTTASKSNLQEGYFTLSLLKSLADDPSPSEQEVTVKDADQLTSIYYAKTLNSCESLPRKFDPQ